MSSVDFEIAIGARCYKISLISGIGDTAISSKYKSNGELGRASSNW